MTKAAAVRIGSTIRVSGDPELAHQMGMALAAPELDRLRAELGVRRNRDSNYYAARIAEARRKYGRPKPVRGWQVALGLIAMLWEERK